MGAVYEACTPDLNKRVAIKTLYPSVGRDAEARARFLREGELASRIRHPHVVDVTDVGTDGRPLPGDGVPRGRGPGAPTRARARCRSAKQRTSCCRCWRRWSRRTTCRGDPPRPQAPEHLPGRGPDAASMQPKVLDFGISKLTADARPAPLSMVPTSLVKTVGMMGSPSYFSPEQVQGTAPLSAASGIGAHGNRPLRVRDGAAPAPGRRPGGRVPANVRGQYQSAREVRPDLPEPFEQVITKAMSIEPADRYPSVREMGHALLPFASEKTRLVWEETFGEAALRAHAAGRLGRPSPVPVTVQTPGPPLQTHAPTVAMANKGGGPAEPGVRLEPTIESRAGSGRGSGRSASCCCWAASGRWRCSCRRAASGRSKCGRRQHRRPPQRRSARQRHRRPSRRRSSRCRRRRRRRSAPRRALPNRE